MRFFKIYITHGVAYIVLVKINNLIFFIRSVSSIKRYRVGCV
nr:MAG TPA: hypothetical protein [Caudoviricetes sp.]